MDLHFIFVQSFGIIATICFLLSYQVKSNKGLYLLQAAGCGAFAIQYLLLGAYSGCLSQVFVITRNLMLSRYNQWAWVRSKFWVPVFIVLAFIIIYFTWDGPISLIPLFIMVFGTIGMWTNNAGLAILNEAFIIISVMYSIVRFGWRHMLDPESEFQKK